MSDNAGDSGSSVIPGLKYNDAPAAIAFLCEAFGFEARLVVPGEPADKIAHAQLVHGSGMIMLGSSGDTPYDNLVQPPGAPGDAVTQSIVVRVEDVDGHCARARAAGAEIVMEPVDQHYGGRLYTCRDPEGHLWNFGSYDPWATM